MRLKPAVGPSGLRRTRSGPTIQVSLPPRPPSARYIGSAGTLKGRWSISVVRWRSTEECLAKPALPYRIKLLSQPIQQHTNPAKTRAISTK